MNQLTASGVAESRLTVAARGSGGGTPRPVVEALLTTSTILATGQDVPPIRNPCRAVKRCLIRRSRRAAAAGRGMALAQASDGQPEESDDADAAPCLARAPHIARRRRPAPSQHSDPAPSPGGGFQAGLALQRQSQASPSGGGTPFSAVAILRLARLRPHV